MNTHKEIEEIIKNGGMMAVNKPVGPSSYDVIRAIKKIAQKKEKIGHAGTLDPLAEGVIVVAIKREYTKKIGRITNKEKVYEAEFTLGQTSETDDHEGEKVDTNKSQRRPEKDEIEQVISQYIGHINQTPPAYSAIKINGKPSYKRARKGEVVEMKQRPVWIKEIVIKEYNYPTLSLTVTTGPGVYIRALARDIGESLKTGAYMSALKRTRIGEYTLADALDFGKLEKMAQPKDIDKNQ
ncbi:MAG: tRNA pseudouridine(55) synthase TruB [Candidatus Moranbacteria bacterium]|nr:tRNA pseudouridine(55) synthase TruB [Candidatus Moranbacteria bacterium]